MPHVGCVHRSCPLQLELPPHVTSHAHELPQATFRHDCSPLQSTVHFPAPHTTSWQELFPKHSTEQDVVLAQLTPLRHEFSALHLTLHAHPAGQTTLAAQFAVAQSIVHVRAETSHDEQLLGQGAASTTPSTQTLSMQLRPELQSRDELQAKSSLRRSIAHAVATAINAVKSTAVLTECLRRSGRCQRPGRTRSA